MPLMKLLSRIFKDKAHRDYKKLEPLLEEIKALRPQMQELDDDQLKGKTGEFRERMAAGETEDDLLVEAFAVVWEACRRLAERGESWEVSGDERTWDMVPYDVQIIGGISLHQGRVAEMATGEGKTLVASMPMYLNALSGKGAHLITVNDYLARRDSEWIGGLYRWLGLGVGCIVSNMSPADRREAYNCDITYGTNNEFGFDYLRDNMAVRREDLVQRNYNYAIIDEVDSVLIDEARTPLIISGPVGQSNDRFDELKPYVEKLVRRQTRLLNDYLSEAERSIEQGDGKIDDETALKLLRVSRGGPKMKRWLKMLKTPGVHEAIRRIEGDFLRDKAMWEADAELFYVIEEKQNTVDLTEKGREEFGLGDPEFFVLPDLSEEMGRIEGDESLSPEGKAKALDELHQTYGERNEGVHNVQQLLKAFTLFAKDDEYVVHEGRIVIVDEFTGRLMEGRRFSDGLHSALEAKEGLKVQGETQTYATITLQNLFRMYDKLAGMTGTAETEESEFHEIYKLDVMVIPTNKPIRRVDMDDLIYRTKREKLNAIAEEVGRLHEKGLPVLVGTTTVEMSETLSRMFRRKGIRHNVLNAKQHDREAQIVAEAGQRYAVTIATNMAGRGTDIKLGPGVLTESGEVDGDPAGLQIIGSERHESRRIDRQLRGRAGRQGDPGSSKFYVSLEDDLMRLFNSDRVMKLMDRMGLEEGEVITHGMVTKALERAQTRVEKHNFSIRKRLLDYDDVMNKQREVVYAVRRESLVEEDISEQFRGDLEEVVEDLVEEYCPEGVAVDEWGWEPLSLEFSAAFLIPFPIAEEGREELGREALLSSLHEAAMEAYRAKEARLSPEITRQLERHITLRTIDELWKDHLHELDSLRSGIGLRAYGQKDPLLEYKSESFNMFEAMMERRRRDTVSRFFRAEISVAPPPPSAVMAGGQARKADAGAAGGQGSAASPGDGAGRAATPVVGAGGSAGPMQGVFAGARASKPGQPGQAGPGAAGTVEREGPKVGRNDPCPCGSGKKYKKCHGRS